MAARRNPRFYIYQFSDADGVVYVGKGSGRRFVNQKRKFLGTTGQIVDWFISERAAYEAERKRIADLSPRLNIHPGGNGSRVRIAGHTRRKSFWERNFEKIGGRKYAARLLLACESAKTGSVDPSKLEAIRQVAHGCRA